MPVELVNFRGTAVESGNLIQWETASERNNDFFNVERSGNAREWEAIAKIDGRGDSDQIVSYQFLDARPLPGRVFYRLKQVDFDGGFEYSYIISVVTGELPQFQVQSVYPNPSPSKIRLSYISNNEQPIEYRIFSESGRLIRSGVISNFFGSNEVELTLPDENGIYLLSLQNQQLVVTRKILKADF